MNVDNIPNYIKQVLQNRELSMVQKMVGFMLLMPQLPDDPKNNKLWEDGEILGQKIKHLVDTGKIHLDGFDKDFKLKVRQL